LAPVISLGSGALHVYLRPELTVIEREGREVGKWDLEGRPLSLQTEGTYFRRGISHRCMVRGRFERTGRILTGEEAASFLERTAVDTGLPW